MAASDIELLCQENGLQQESVARQWKRTVRLGALALTAAGAVAVAKGSWALPGALQAELASPNPIHSGSVRLGGAVGLSGKVGATMEGSCPLPENWCNGTGSREDTLSYRDCDGDGILDPYCEGGFLLRFGYISSKSDCKDNWPNGICKAGRNAEEDEASKSTAEHAADNEITIIHFNDVYNVAGNLEKGTRRGGMSRAMHMVNYHRKRNPDRTFVVFAGDGLSPSVLSDMFKGEQMIDILNEMKLDAASLGNHEFDFGIDVMTKRLKESQFPWLNINLMDENGKLLESTVKYFIKEIPWTPRWKPSDKEKLKVCFFGVAYDVRMTMFKDTDRVKFKEVLEASKDAVKHLREEEQCNVVIPLTHQFSKQDCELSAALGKDIDLILGGHDHSTEFTSVCGHAPYVKAASDLKTQWIMTLYLDDNGKVDSVDGNLLSLTDADPFCEKMHDKVVQWEERAEKENAKKLGCLAVDLDANNANVRSRETTMGNFATDAVRAVHETDVAIINGGTLRGDKTYSKGDILRQTVVEFHPYGNQVVKIYMTGKEFKDYLEICLKCINTFCGNFVQMSGMKYEFDPTKPEGERVVKLTTLDGDEVADDKEFTCAITDYMLANSPMAKNKLYKMTTLNDAVPLVQSFMETIQDGGDECVDVKIDGRITDISKK